MISRISKNIKYNIFFIVRHRTTAAPLPPFPKRIFPEYFSSRPRFLYASTSFFLPPPVSYPTKRYENTEENARAPENKRGKKGEGRDVEEEGNNVGDNARTGLEQM